jgi:4'-phosphopantetheinyl transferase
VNDLAAQAQVWLLPTDPAPEPGLAERWWGLLDDEDRARALRLIRPADRERSVLSHAFLRLCLSRHADLPPHAWRFQRDAHGRPWVAGDLADALYFSLSHCRGLTAVLVSDLPRCGVDAERLDAVRDPMLVAKSSFTPAERAALEATNRVDRRRTFTEGWVLKEAWAKARGLGLELPFDKAGFEIGSEDAVKVAFLDSIDSARSWRFQLHRPTGEHVMGVALRDGGEREVEVGWAGRPEIELHTGGRT